MKLIRGIQGIGFIVMLFAASGVDVGGYANIIAVAVGALMMAAGTWINDNYYAGDDEWDI